MSETGKKPARKTRKAAAREIPDDAIERRAYEKFAGRGYAHGADFDDWRDAEEELASELTPRPKRASKVTARAGDAGATKPMPKKRTAKDADAPATKGAARRTTKKA